jgi:hypothetical protein
LPDTGGFSLGLERRSLKASSMRFATDITVSSVRILSASLSTVRTTNGFIINTKMTAKIPPIAERRRPVLVRKATRQMATTKRIMASS